MARDDDGRLWAFDQGLCLHEEPKLRTILWGWAGERLDEWPSARCWRTARGPRAATWASGSSNA